MNTIEVVNPFNFDVIDTVALKTAAEVETAMAKAHRLHHNRAERLPAHRRIEILQKTAHIMSEQVDALTRLAASEGGKPYIDSKVEVLRAINGVKMAAEYIAQIKGEEIPMGLTPASEKRLAFTQREPIGVVSSISAFNHPLNLIVHQTVPAIAVGAPVLVKPASATPLSCLRFIEILYEAGLPESWCQAVVCDNTLAEKLVTDPRVDFFSFIGSARIGWMLRSKLAPGTRCALEHGGVAPVIVDQHVDLDAVVDSVLKGGFYHAGQVCVSVQRVYVHDEVCDQFADALAAKAAKLRVGDPLDKQTEVGPLILPKELNRVAEWVDEAKTAGANIRVGGDKMSDSCYAPTVIVDAPDQVRVSTQEVFGPVVCVYRYQTLDEAVSRANALPEAFQASIFTNRLDTALNIGDQLNATAVMVNDHTAFRVDWMPFGGRKVSGIGMGGIPYSMHEMTEEKMLVINRN